MRKSSRKFYLLLTLVMLGLAACQQHKQRVAAQPDAVAGAGKQVLQVLQDQASCWSQGDLTCYMEGYWKSDSLVFIGKHGLTYGWQNTLENYRKSYPDKAAMGRLEFEILENKPLSENMRLVIGKWMLIRTEGDLEGHFSVIFRRFPEGWKIVADHSS